MKVKIRWYSNNLVKKSLEKYVELKFYFYKVYCSLDHKCYFDKRFYCVNL